MPERNWQHEVQQNLADYERRQASILHNPGLARLYIERGVGVALVVVFTAYGSMLRAISQDVRHFLFAGTIFGTLVAIALVSIGVTGFVYQHRERQAAPRRDDEPPAIGW